jgi:tetratricopeptide (TPR) repeat protein
MDLAAIGNDDHAAVRLYLAGYLALALRMLVQFGAPESMAYANEALNLFATQTECLIRAAPKASGAQSDASVWACSASELAMAAISLFHVLPKGSREFPVAAMGVLERVLAATSVDSNPVRHATCLHDLGHAYSQYATHETAEREVELLEHAASLFRECLVVYRNLRGRPEFLLAMHNRPAHVDYLNLGQAYLRLAEQGGSLGVFASPLYIREALCVLAMARDIALETGFAHEATHAQTSLARLSTQLAIACLEHTRANKGALRSHFHDWLCAIEGPVLSTWDFATRYASFALGQADAAIATSIRVRNEDMLRNSLLAAFEAWQVAELRHGVSGVPVLMDDNWWNIRGFREHALLSIDEVLAQLSVETEGFETLLPEVSDYRNYFSARASLVMFEEASRNPDDLVTATERFDSLGLLGGIIPRALSRSYADWFRVSRTDDRISVNGLMLGVAEAGLEVSFLAQRQAFVIGGLKVEALGVDTRESSWIKTNAVTAIADSYPQINWSGVPSMVPVMIGLCRCGDRPLQILAVQIPTTSWDSWVLHVASGEEGFLEFDLPLSLLGSDAVPPGSAISREDDQHQNMSAATLAGSAVVAEIRVGRESQESGRILELTAKPGNTHVCTAADEITITFRMTPTIVDAGVAVLARCDSSFVGACGASAFNLVSPSPSIPSALIRAYSSLYLFADRIDPKIVDQVRNSSVRQLIVVGVPSSSVDLDDFLETVFEPRRELTFLVTTGEVAAVMAATERLHGRIHSSFGSPLFAVARSLDDELENAIGIQVIDVGRELAPAAAQMVLDLAAFRDLPLEDIPTGSSDMPYQFQVLGNPSAMRRKMAELPTPATWLALTAKYVELLDLAPLVTLGSTDNDAIKKYQALMSAPIARRPCLIVPAGESAVALACTPYARHVGAILLPDTPEAASFIAAAKPLELHIVEGSAIGGRAQVVTPLPAGHVDIALAFCELARRDHESRTERWKDQADEVTSRLMSEMRPNAYVVMASISDSEFWAATLAANYAAALGSPLLLFDDDAFFSSEVRAQSSMMLSGQGADAGAGTPTARHILPRNTVGSPPMVTPSARPLQSALERMSPLYVGMVSNRLTIPLEMIGDPPLGVRYAFGRLCAPDLTSLSLLISAAALREEVRRDPTVRVLVSEAADAVAERPLPGARQEGIHLSDSLSRSADLSVTFVSGSHDLRDFIAESKEASIIHFAGHGQYNEEDPDESALVFSGGRLRAADVPVPLKGAPIVYSNACESGLGSATEELRSWTGLAAAFIQAGAVNYIGSLWPIYDESSLRVAEQFYALLNTGHSTGEALRRAKSVAFEAADTIWAALVLFGCPRNTLRSKGSKGANEHASVGTPKPELDNASKTSSSSKRVEARKISEPAAQKRSDKAKYWHLSAQRYVSRGDWGAAERDIRMACELDSTQASYVVTFCDCLCQQGRWSEALELLLSDEVQFADSWQIQEALGRVHNELQHYEASCAALEKALSLKPDDPAAIQARLGMSYRKRGDLETAERYLRLAYAATPTDHLVLLFLLQWFKDKMFYLANERRASELEAASKEADLVLEVASKGGVLDADLLFVKAQLRLILRLPREALEILAVARDMDPDHPLIDRIYLPLKAQMDRLASGDTP